MRDKAKRIGVFLGVVILVVGLSAGVSGFIHPDVPVDETESPEYDTAELNIDPLPATGQVDVDLTDSDAVVVFDMAHFNRYERSDIRELTSALTTLGATVRFYQGDEDLEEELADADAFVVIDPMLEIDDEDIDTVETFVDEGGRLVMMAEPDRSILALVGLQVEVLTERSEIDDLANRMGFSFGGDFIYNLEHNDGNHQNVIIRPSDGAGTQLSHLDDVDQGVFYASTFVNSQSADPILVAEDGTQRFEGDSEDREFVVAAVDGDVMALGDTTFLAGDKHNVADNEQVVAAVVEFLVTGDREAVSPPGNLDVDDDDSAETDVEDGTDESA